MKVFIVWLEYQADTPDILAVFASKTDADIYAAHEQQKLLAAGDIIEGVNDTDDDGDLDWTVTIHLDEQEVL